MEDVWVFQAPGANFASGVFADLADAEHWIAAHRLTGTLTKYPVGIGVYEWCIARGTFKPKKPGDSTPAFIGSFSSAYQEHYHYENGE